MVGFTVAMIFGGLLSIASQVLIMLAVGADAKALGVKDRTLWMVLSFFIPICAIVYLCIRKTLTKSVPKYCPNCGATSPPNAVACVQCGNPMLMDYQVADAPKHQKSAKTFMISGIIAYVLAVVILLVGYFGFFFSTIREFGNEIDNGIQEFREFDPYEDYEDYFDDYEDYFDDYGDFPDDME